MNLFAITLKLQKHIGIKENAEILVRCYRISSNNSRPSINRLPRIIALLWRKYLKWLYPSNNRPLPVPLAIFSSWSRQVEVQCDPAKLISDELIKEINLQHLKSPCSVYLMWLFLDLMGKWNKIFRVRLPVNNIWNNRLPRIIAPFLCEKRNNRPRLLFEEIRYSKLLYCVDCILVPRASWGPEHEDKAALGTRGTQHCIWSPRF